MSLRCYNFFATHNQLVSPVKMVLMDKLVQVLMGKLPHMSSTWVLGMIPLWPL